jgi:hypothetical protein
VSDEVRLLHRRSGYTHLTSQAIPGEPEAVDADAQDDLTARAHRQQRTTWEVGRDRILSEVEHLTMHVKSPHMRRGARALQRELAALDRKLA